MTKTYMMELTEDEYLLLWMLFSAVLKPDWAGARIPDRAKAARLESATNSLRSKLQQFKSQ